MNGNQNASVCMGMITVDFSLMTCAVQECIIPLSPRPNHRPRLPEEPWCSLPSPENKDGLGQKENNRFKRSLFYCSSHDYVHVFLISEKPHCICFFFFCVTSKKCVGGSGDEEIQMGLKGMVGGKRLDSILQCFLLSWFSRFCSWKKKKKKD